MSEERDTSGSPGETLLISEQSVLGDPWVPIYKRAVDFDAHHFETAMANLIRQPNINSTVILRADILKENVYDPEKGDTMFVSKMIDKVPDFPSTSNSDDNSHKTDLILHRYLDDATFRSIPTENCSVNLVSKCEIVRRIIPRNPFKDHIINQTCLVLTSQEGDKGLKSDDSVLVVYIPHIKSSEETPFYLPPVYAVGILYHQGSLSIQYLGFNYEKSNDETTLLRNMDPAERPIRIALRLLQTSAKHSLGAKTGYEKRVNHDMVVPKTAFQNRYISLKKKYSSKLVNQWCESTDPKKHVFEDLAIAAFLIEFWSLKYKDSHSFEFRDLGCGNGLLVYILINEGYRGIGIDARARKSWAIYPKEVQDCLKEQVIIPSILLRPHPAVSRIAPHVTDNGRYYQVAVQGETASQSSEVMAPGGIAYYSSSSLLSSPQVCTTDDFPKDTFIIGNHSDELTCWIPLLGYSFMVIPCCSHALSGAKARYSPRKAARASKSSSTSTVNSSTYGALVDHVEDLAVQMGWDVEKEMLRIPSTRNAAIIGSSKKEISDEAWQTRVLDILALSGGAEGFVENSMALTKRAPRNH
ncbi:predicted protein [Scheffersomyces stipitis CBS 6054]|uniref:tRNA (uracil-O(2)-)-methyltransferase n=1 Tax=Scheffersomyces stipitis (strain ATCC 58785 / CBS 6054 / NBRC 10063 / NRRL Y-11545) TaxID=322104 RepID=A3LXB8_PICST|nr:predicted protein [Scheffersomyces stipitis CBS 6054]ABN67778.2 predicted protein [Scheffersomyces stipitis CBS 6054]